MGFHDAEQIIPNDSVKIIGSAYLDQPYAASNKAVGTVVKTSTDYTLLWMLAFPFGETQATLCFDEHQGFSEHPVSVVIDTKTFETEFTVGHVTFNGKEASLNFFAIPNFFATLLLKEPNKSAHS